MICIYNICEVFIICSGCSAVGSAHALGAWGRGFKSHHPELLFDRLAPVAQQDRAVDF